MPTSNPLDILLAHDRWATRQILDVCATLTEDQFHQRFEIGPGSLHDTTTHMFAAMQAWTQTLALQEPKPRIDQDRKRRTPAELIEIHESSASDFAGEARRLPLDQLVTRVREGKTYQFTRGAVLTHVATHSMHHRAQCLNMLRHVGVKPLPPSSVVEWTRMAEPT
ncbi:MAG TPA: DinB family protein [Humisphaera sp.]|nr:DinB family protein [Humisphaera sp.]